ncbi:MAG: Asp23/Gls24 family envelope stress response protein [Clostridiales bacterium]|nr:Asp23/Gls24 family envelope stress response protein [Clostridiales bacterium]
MYIYGFVGPSGTGKSHRAQWVAKEKYIDYIIDDGLLIKGNSVIAGRSAKKESTKLASVKTAVFTDDSHAFEVSETLRINKAQSLLILGTSERMVDKIARRLGFSGIDKYIHIEDVSSEYEIQQALDTRRFQGKHVIPVPTMELKKDFSGYFLDPLRILRRKGTGSYEEMGEKSVVRPTFSYLGNYTISDYTIYQIVECVTYKTEGVSRISRFSAENVERGITMEVDLVLCYGFKIPELLRNLKKDITSEVEKLTALNIVSLILTAKSLILDKSKKST